MNENPLPSPGYDPQRSERRSGRAGGIATVLVVAAIVVAGLATRGWLFRPAADVGTGGDMACDITEPFEDVRIDVVSCDVSVSAGGNTCAVEYRGPSRMACTAEVKNGTLQIEEKRVRRLSFWNWFSRRNSKLTVILPQEQYDALELCAVSGDVKLEDGGLFRDLRIATTSGDMDLTGAGGGDVTLESTSGDMEFRDGSASSLSVGTTSGDVAVTGVDVSGRAVLSTISGEVALLDADAESLSVSTTSGNVTVTGVDVTGRTELSTTSGDVVLLDADAESLSISTTSGDVRTELRTPKEYVTHTVSGDVSVANNVPGAGRCEIETVSGEILCR